jgi:hypothetical protein
MRKFLTAAIIAGGLAWANPAAAETFSFDMNGTGTNTVGPNVIDPVMLLNDFSWAPGNTILIEPSTVGGQYTIVYQANYDWGGIDCNLLFDGKGCLTAVAVFNVEPIVGSPGAFTILAGGTFQIWADETAADDLAGGTAFADDTLILDATFLAGGSASVVVCPITDLNCPALENLDQFSDPSDNDWLGYLTPEASGGFTSITAEATVTDLNLNYFIDPRFTIGTTLFVTSGSNNLPFTQVDPTGQFWNGESGVSSLCSFIPNGTTTFCVNGSTSRIMAEADANTTLDLPDVQQVVPEPATLSLLGLGLFAAAAVRRRQLRKKA